MSGKNELVSVARRLFGTRTEADVYNVAVRSLFRHTEADECALATLEDDGLVSRASMTSGLIDVSEGPLADNFGLIEQAHREDETVVVADLAACPQGWQFHHGASNSQFASEEIKPYRSLLCVPLEQDGTLVATADQSGAFDRETRETAERIASLVEEALKQLSEPSKPPETSSHDRLEKAASTLNHEMMSKLMIANSRLEAARADPDPEHFDHVADVHDRIESFVEDMARYLRAGRRIPDPEPTDLRTAAERAWSVVETPGMELQLPEPLEVVADEEMVIELFENLFQNAAEHGFSDDQVVSDTEPTVRVGRIETGGGFYIEDNGQGIGFEDSDSAFEAGVTTAARGSGQGLSICRDIAEVHDWEIDITDREAPGVRVAITGVEFVGDSRDRSSETVSTSGFSH
jgi:signal transduction histidine kinase